MREIKARRRTFTAADTAEELRREFEYALSHPTDIFGYARYGDGRKWSRLDSLSGGIQPRSLSVLAARPKRGKSMLAAAWVPYIAEQALAEDAVVRVVTLEMQRKSYQRRMAALMAGITDPMNIRRGKVEVKERKAYLKALDQLSALPIEYLSNEVDLSEEEAMVAGNSPVTIDEVSAFVRGQTDDEHRPTYWWLLDHIGLLSDLSSFGDVTTSIYSLANKLAVLAHGVATGLIITHLTRNSVGSMPSIESIAGSDQVGRNADQIFLLSRPFMDVPDPNDEDQEVMKEGEPAFLQFYSRDEGSGVDVLWWDKNRAAFDELLVAPDASVPMPSSTRKRKK